MQLSDDLMPARVFVAARGRLAQARAARDGMDRAWRAGMSAAVATMDAWVESLEGGTHEVWSFFEVPDEHELAVERAAGEFLVRLKDALDAGVLAAANATSRWGMADPAAHQMPLCRTAAEFDDLPRNESLRLLRPDQIRVLRQMQPFSGGTRVRNIIGSHATHLLNLLEARRRGSLRCRVWASRGAPRFDAPDGVTISDLQVDEAGLVDPLKRVASYRVDPSQCADDVSVNPMTSFDLVLDADPAPADADDNAAARTDLLLTLARRLIEALERSVAAGSFLEQFGRLDVLLPIEASSEWAPVRFEEGEERQARDAIAASEIGRAVYRAEGGFLLFLRVGESGRVLGREIPSAAPPPATGQTHGLAIEHATRAVGARWGLPDFVLVPSVVRKGSGVREYPDGTIVSGSRGVALQVKARNAVGDSPQRATNWLLKKGAEGLAQARGTIRTTLGHPQVTLNNLRGRAITFNGRSIDWLPVVILDHPNPPEVTARDDGKGPNIVLLRRDWEFLWYQLRSAAAIVDYLHRVAEQGSVELGTETYRYFDLARKDANAGANPTPEWLRGSEARAQDGPLLPSEPAAASDEAGHAIFHAILEDIASSPFEGNEADRVRVLALVDRFSVTHRAELGRTLLRRLDYCAAAQQGEIRAHHKIAYVDGGATQLIFTVMGQLTAADLDYFHVYVAHRRQLFLRGSAAQGPVLPWTVAVALTPRADGHRPWDTTVIATNAPELYDDEEFENIGRAFAPHGGHDRVAD